ncbi:hypothetical protein [Sphingomonas radiodurans]|uniref:hypothetical protein n=1 Tax=Sphingomonas radiodurans TaxID=2890321 RepID=UPI001E3C9766|nr:hypothetical protein [Sphingomonas radiodurans]WBH18052.1 hypothetical protein LLW23_08160 [Sphingomonas radiodurans]
MEVSKIRLIRNDVSVWLVYAGRGRKFFDLFRQTRSVFLSLPGFDANETVFQSDELIRRHLAMSDAVGRWISGADSNPPSRRPNSYNPYPNSDAGSFAHELGNIYRLFIDAKPGDLVLSPTHGHFDPYLVGEITQPWRKEDDTPIPLLEDELVPTRKVRWLNTALARRDFPARVSRRLQNQHAITKIDTDLYQDIFGLVYPSYVWGQKSKLDVFGDSYTGTDPLQPYASALLVKYVVASVFAYEKGEFAAFQKLEPHAAIDAFYDETLVSEFGQNFNSPGKFTIIAAVGSLSILASAGLIVATADPAQPFNQTKTEAVQTVSGAMTGAGKAPRTQELDGYVNSMTAVNWTDVQKKLGKPSNDTMKTSLSNSVEVATHRAELNAR